MQQYHNNQGSKLKQPEWQNRISRQVCQKE